MAESNRAALIDEIIQAYVATGNSIRIASLPAWVSSELNLSQLKAIVLLEHHGKLTISTLARLLGTGNSATSILVQQLVEAGLVERSEDSKDRRRTFVQPTPAGIGLVAGRREKIKTNLVRWLEEMDDADLACLQRGLSALFQSIQKEQAGKIEAGDQGVERFPTFKS